MQVVIDGLLTNYQKQGSGKKCVLLLHGWGDSLTTFSDLSNNLEKTYTVYSLDLPGFGQSQIPDESWSLDNYGHFIHNFLDKLGVHELLGVVGHSNGGAVAIRSISMQAFEPKKLVLLSASGIRNSQPVRRLILKVIAKTGKVATFWLPRRYKRKLQKKLYGVAASDMLVVPHMKETYKITVRQDVQQDAKHVQQPTLLIYGDSDKATPPEFGRIYKKLMTNAKLEIVDNAEHFVHHDQPEIVTKLIEEFLK